MCARAHSKVWKGSSVKGMFTENFVWLRGYGWKNWLLFLFPALLIHTLFPALSVHMSGICFSSEENICLFHVSAGVCCHKYIMWQWQCLENKAINIQRAKNCCHHISLNLLSFLGRIPTLTLIFKEIIFAVFFKMTSSPQALQKCSWNFLLCIFSI